MKKTEEGEDEDDLPNTYDYSDSFINDSSQSLKPSQDSLSLKHDDVDEDELDDAEELAREAKSFIKNKKLQKPIRDV